jgi:hypothetical protein
MALQLWERLLGGITRQFKRVDGILQRNNETSEISQGLDKMDYMANPNPHNPSPNAEIL